MVEIKKSSIRKRIRIATRI